MGRDAVPRVFPHDDRIISRTRGSLGKMRHVSLAVRPRQLALVANPSVRAHGYDKFECQHHDGLELCDCNSCVVVFMFIFKII